LKNYLIQSWNRPQIKRSIKRDAWILFVWPDKMSVWCFQFRADVSKSVVSPAVSLVGDVTARFLANGLAKFLWPPAQAHEYDNELLPHSPFPNYCLFCMPLSAYDVTHLFFPNGCDKFEIVNDRIMLCCYCKVLGKFKKWKKMCLINFKV